MTTVEVFADITCPFTHVGLKQVVGHVAEMREPADVIVRAWPLEWVNGTPLANLAMRHEDGTVEMLSDFGYAEFRSRLGR